MKAGDVVKLKTGGPNMTIDTVVNDAIKCVWFSPRPDQSWDGPYSDVFKRDSLVEIS